MLQDFKKNSPVHERPIVTTAKIMYYIGADNKTGEVNKQAIIDCLDRHFDGYNLFDALGRWQGTNEKCINIMAYANIDVSTAQGIAQELRQSCSQDSILMEYNNQPFFVE